MKRIGGELQMKRLMISSGLRLKKGHGNGNWQSATMIYVALWHLVGNVRIGWRHNRF